jgi:hypothetical protein
VFAGVFRRFLEDLLDGDPVALTVLAVLAGVALLFGLFWLKVRRDLRREDEQRKRKQPGRGPKQGRG